MILTEPFEIINWDQYIRTIELDKYSYSSALKLLSTFMTIVESEKVYLLHTGVIFLALIIFGVGSLDDTHFWQFFKMLNLRQNVTNNELKYHITSI